MSKHRTARSCCCLGGVRSEVSDNLKRKTKIRPVAVRKQNLAVNMDSQVPNKVVGEWLSGRNLTLPCRWSPSWRSRIDFYMEKGLQNRNVSAGSATAHWKGGIGYSRMRPIERGVKTGNEPAQARAGVSRAAALAIQMEGASTEVRFRLATQVGVWHSADNGRKRKPQV